MNFGINVPQFAQLSDTRLLADLAKLAEDSGWDGFFIWDSILLNGSGLRVVDPWVALSAIGLATQKLRIGPLVTPLARRRPWKLAREATSVDHLTNGRLILGVGLGDDVDWDFGAFGETTDARVRAEQLDEGLEIINALWTGRPLTHTGRHYSLRNVQFLPRPVQRPRIPIWVGGFWPRRGPMRRAARWDGTCPLAAKGRLSPEDWKQIGEFIARRRDGNSGFDRVHFGATSSAKDTASIEDVRAYENSGVTWWIESFGPERFGIGLIDPYPDEAMDLLTARIAGGPPRV